HDERAPTNCTRPGDVADHDPRGETEKSASVSETGTTADAGGAELVHAHHDHAGHDERAPTNCTRPGDVADHDPRGETEKSASVSET
ncbi:hypothetical protein CTI14_66085, partial [Methylobacterium radiotolerans]